MQQQYAIDNPLKFVGYGKDCWGISASDGPGPDTIKVSGIERQFFDYLGREYRTDRTTALIAAVGRGGVSYHSRPEIVLPVLDYCIHDLKLKEPHHYGFREPPMRLTPLHPATPTAKYRRGIRGSMKGRLF